MVTCYILSRPKTLDSRKASIILSPLEVNFQSDNPTSLDNPYVSSRGFEVDSLPALFSWINSTKRVKAGKL